MEPQADHWPQTSGMSPFVSHIGTSHESDQGSYPVPYFQDPGISVCQLKGQAECI